MRKGRLAGAIILGVVLSGLGAGVASAEDFKAGRSALPGDPTEAKVQLEPGDTPIAAREALGATIGYVRSWIFKRNGRVYGKASTRSTRTVSLLQVRNYICVDSVCSR